MKELVIHPIDPTTDFLKTIYSDRHCTVINMSISHDLIIKEIQNHDKIIMLGHGTPVGLLNEFCSGYIINASFVPYLKEKECVYIWCNADQFVIPHNLNGFYTGMIISEVPEALMYDIYVNEQTVNISNELFANAVKNAIFSESQNKDILVKENYDILDNKVVVFNRERIYYK